MPVRVPHRFGAHGGSSGTRPAASWATARDPPKMQLPKPPMRQVSAAAKEAANPYAIFMPADADDLAQDSVGATPDGHKPLPDKVPPPPSPRTLHPTPPHPTPQRLRLVYQH